MCQPSSPHGQNGCCRLAGNFFGHRGNSKKIFFPWFPLLFWRPGKRNWGCTYNFFIICHLNSNIVHSLTNHAIFSAFLSLSKVCILHQNWENHCTLQPRQATHKPAFLNDNGKSVIDSQLKVIGFMTWPDQVEFTAFHWLCVRGLLKTLGEIFWSTIEKFAVH